MTKSTITREQLEEWVAQLDEDGGCDATDRQLEALIRQSLSAMDSSESVELPLDYLQGHKDGLEWASQLAEANHPETGDWLYDDPIELAKAIRKGPDMPPVQPVADSEPVAWTWQYLKQWYVTNDEEHARELAWDGVKVEQLYRHAQPAPVVPDEINSASAPEVFEIAAEAERLGLRGTYASYAVGWNACRAAMLNAGNSPAQSDCCPAQNCIHSAQGVDRPVAWHHSAKSKEGNHGTCCFSYASSHDFGPRYEKPQSQPHYLPERLDYDRALHFLSTEPRKVTPETVIGGNSPAIPDGYVMVPKEPTEAMMLHNSGCQHHAWDDPDCAMRQTRRLIWSHMLAAAPQSPGSEPATVPGKWIPVSERMPELGDWLVTDGCDFDVQLFNGEQFIPGFVWEDKITHWMPLPAAPQEVKGE